MTARYAQLSYTSYDAGHGTAGGWQIKETTGDLSEEESRRLMTGMRTVLSPAQPLPDYPTPEQLAAAPRRLAYRDGRYWHTALAGVDSTSRPGNVFVHALLDRRPLDEPVDRPIERWQSPEWLSPYGPAAVSQAELPRAVPQPCGTITRDSCVAFALEPQAWRLTTLLALLDAVGAAMAGGPPVLLGTESPDVAAHWIGAVSYLMAARTATTMSFSTFDRIGQFDPAAGDHLTAVPVADLETPTPGAVTIDGTATLVQLGELDGQPHVTSTGQSIPAGAWSTLAQVVLLEDADVVAGVLSELDGVAAAAGDTIVHPVWPLAVVVAADPRFADTATEAHRVIAAHTPSTVAAGSEHATITAATVAHLCGTTTADAWRGLQQCTALGPAALAGQTYLVRAIADPEWLDQPGTIPAPARPRPDTLLPSQLAAAIGPALDAAREHGPLRLIRLIDLLDRAGISNSLFRTAIDSHIQVFGHPVEGPLLVERLGPHIGPATRLIIATSLFRSTWDAIPAAYPVLTWLAAGMPIPTVFDAVRGISGDIVWTHSALAGSRILATSTPATLDNPLGLWWLRECNQTVAFTDAAGRRVWDPETLLAAAGNTPLSADIVLRTLLGSPPSAGLDRLCDAIIAAGADEVAKALAMARRLPLVEWESRDLTDTRQSRFVQLWEEGLKAIALSGLDPSTMERMLCLSVMAAARRRPYPHACVRWRARAAVDDLVVESVSPLYIGDPATRRRVLALHLLGDDAEADAPDADRAAAGAPSPDGMDRQDSRPDDHGDPREHGDNAQRRWRLRGRDKGDQSDKGEETTERRRARKNDSKRADARTDHVTELLERVVGLCAAASGDADEAATIAALMSDITSDTSDKAAKRYLRSAMKLIAEHQKRPSLANRLRGNH